MKRWLRLFGPKVRGPETVGMSHMPYEGPLANPGTEPVGDVGKRQNLKIKPAPLKVSKIATSVTPLDEFFHEKGVLMTK